MKSHLENPAPANLEEVLEPAWLSGALSAQHPGCQVRTTTVVDTQQTLATKVRFRVDYVQPGNPPAPEALCVKGYFHEEGWRRKGMGETETRFYRELAAEVGTRVAPCSYTGIDEETLSAVVIMTDLVEAGATFLTALSPYSPDQTAATLDQLAILHARNWGSSALDLDWLQPKIARVASSMSVERLQELLDRPRSEGLPSSILSATRLHDGLAALVATGFGVPCLIHGDVHAGNVFETADGPGLIDWQLAQRGGWATDVAYHIGAVLDIEERRAREGDLLRHYLERLAAYGVDAPPFNEAEQAYRMNLVYGFFLWAMTQFVDEPITTQFLQRLGSAVSDNESFQLLGV